jgi:DNA-binding HxlR family transcriptional regulator
MLSERLRELEGEGIVARIVVPETPVRVEYELTEKGRALEQALCAVGRWAERWVDAEDAPAAVKAPRPAPAAARGRR